MSRLIGSLLFVLAIFVSHIDAARYRVIDIGRGQFDETEVTSINDRGQVCGVAVSKGVGCVFIWDPINGYRSYKTPFVTKPVLNNREEIAGSFLTREINSPFDGNNLFLWTDPFKRTNKFQDLGKPNNIRPIKVINKTAIAWSMNDLGQILVMNTQELKTPSSSFDLHLANSQIWIFEEGKYQEIQHIKLRYALTINNNSQILGRYFTSGFNPILKTTIYDYNNKTVRELDFAIYVYGIDMNDNGEVAGIFYDPTLKQFKGFLAKEDDVVIEIENFRPLAVNNSGKMIGSFLSEQDKKQSLVVWDNGTLLDLINNDALDKSLLKETWDSFDELVGINDLGQIIGNGKVKGKSRGFILDPIR